MSFLGEDYLLTSLPAKRLYREVEGLPIVDPHGHCDPKRIVENEGWSDIWEMVAGTDHYVWEFMRKRGVPEEKITGDAPDKDKWKALAGVFPQFAGNPVYEWIHLDLKRVFGIRKKISSRTGEEIWKETAARLREKDIRPQQLLNEMGVEIMCTTDEPASNLQYHEKAGEVVKGTRVLPTWRGDRAMKIEADTWKEFVEAMGERTGKDTSDLAGFLDSLEDSHDHFDRHGCVASDYGIQEPHPHPVDYRGAEDIYQKRLTEHGKLSGAEIRDFKAFILNEMGRMDERHDWVTQLHIGAVRNYRDSLFKRMGPDSGGDISTQNIDIVSGLKHFLNEFDERLNIVLYCLDPTHLPTIATISRAFPNVSMGAAWWFNDNFSGMEKQLEYAASVDLLRNFAGAATDSRKLVSYGSKTEMFRRTLCNVVGNMVKRGQVPMGVVRQLVPKVAYGRPKELFFERKPRKNQIY